MTEEVKKTIDRIVAKYPWDGSALLFKSELEYLVEQVRKEEEGKLGRIVDIIHKHIKK